MDYTYQNSLADQPHTILLKEFDLVVRVNGKDTVFPYSQIVSVRLDRNERSFKTMLITESGKIFTITNRFYSEDRKPQDQSRLYATFVRVLHFHLKDKSKAVYTSGDKIRMLTRILSYAAVVFVVSFIAGFLGWRLMNTYVQSLVLALLMGIIVLALNITKWPKHYQPTDIPIDFLPS